MTNTNANSGYDLSFSKSVVLPLPPMAEGAKNEMEIYARFMRHLRHVPNSRHDIKVLSAIQFVADMLDVSDSEVSKVLVDCGLRAPRMAFPAEYLEVADTCLGRESWEQGAANAALRDLQIHWNTLGEDKYAATRRQLILKMTSGLLTEAVR